MQYQLNWQNLQQRRQIARLLLLYKALHNYTALHIPPYYKPSHTNTTAAKYPHTQMKHILQDLIPTLACMYVGILCTRE